MQTASHLEAMVETKHADFRRWSTKTEGRTLFMAKVLPIPDKVKEPKPSIKRTTSGFNQLSEAHSLSFMGIWH